jgi:hypothetical protein
MTSSKLIPLTEMQSQLSLITVRLRRGVIVRSLDRDAAGHFSSATEIGIPAHLADGQRLFEKVLTEPDTDPIVCLAIATEFQAAALPHLSGVEWAKAHRFVANAKLQLGPTVTGLEL